MLFGNLRTQTVDLIVAAVDANDCGAENIGAENFRGFQIGRDEDPGLQSQARSVSGDRVSEIARGRARDGIEAELACLGQRDGYDAILEATRGQADGVILDVDILRGKLSAQLR